MDLNDVERIDLKALGGADNVVVNDLSGTDVTKVAIDLAGLIGGDTGDGATDLVTVIGTAGGDHVVVTSDAAGIAINGLPAEVDIAHAESGDQLVINGLGGDDVIDASGLAAGTIGVQLAGGLGEDTLIGSEGDDLIARRRRRRHGAHGRRRRHVRLEPGRRQRHGRGSGRHRHDALQRREREREASTSRPTASACVSSATSPT